MLGLANFIPERRKLKKALFNAGVCTRCENVRVLMLHAKLCQPSWDRGNLSRALAVEHTVCEGCLRTSFSCLEHIAFFKCWKHERFVL